jgi:hypothetical protein
MIIAGMSFLLCVATGTQFRTALGCSGFGGAACEQNLQPNGTIDRGLVKRMPVALVFGGSMCGLFIIQGQLLQQQIPQRARLSAHKL